MIVVMIFLSLLSTSLIALTIFLVSRMIKMNDVFDSLRASFEVESEELMESLYEIIEIFEVVDESGLEFSAPDLQKLYMQLRERIEGARLDHFGRGRKYDSKKEEREPGKTVAEISQS